MIKVIELLNGYISQLYETQLENLKYQSAFLNG